jgi:uncharacterized NAD-dependent epimerase/dehydratase family protein
MPDHFFDIQCNCELLEMSKCSSFNNGDDFLGQCNAKKNKANKKHKDKGGNFIETATGDLTALRYLTYHAKKRLAERVVSQNDAIKGTKKSGAIMASNGAVVTVIPEAWAAANAERARREHHNKEDKSTNRRQHPDMNTQKLPSGYSRIVMTLAKSNILGIVLGKKHWDMSELIAKQHPLPVGHPISNKRQRHYSTIRTK